jgi:hypothetical protein
MRGAPRANLISRRAVLKYEQFSTIINMRFVAGASATTSQRFQLVPLKRCLNALSILVAWSTGRIVV